MATCLKKYMLAPAIILCVVLCTHSKAQLPVKPMGWISDQEQLFTKEETEMLDSMISKFEKETGNEIGIVTIDSLSVAGKNFDSLALWIANEWGIGKKGINNGVLIAISAAWKKIRIENGYGIVRKMDDARTKEIIDDTIIPEFKKQAYFEGLKKGLLAIMAAIR